MPVAQRRGAAFNNQTVGRGVFGISVTARVLNSALLAFQACPALAGAGVAFPRLPTEMLPGGNFCTGAPVRPPACLCEGMAGATGPGSRELKLHLTSGVGIKAVIEFLSNN